MLKNSGIFKVSLGILSPHRTNIKKRLGKVRQDVLLPQLRSCKFLAENRIFAEKLHYGRLV